MLTLPGSVLEAGNITVNKTNVLVSWGSLSLDLLNLRS